MYIRCYLPLGLPKYLLKKIKKCCIFKKYIISNNEEKNTLINN